MIPLTEEQRKLTERHVETAQKIARWRQFRRLEDSESEAFLALVEGTQKLFEIDPLADAEFTRNFLSTWIRRHLDKRLSQQRRTAKPLSLEGDPGDQKTPGRIETLDLPPEVRQWLEGTTLTDLAATAGCHRTTMARKIKNFLKNYLDDAR